ncbi:hypothetical protein [Pseudomonas phage ZQG1]|nr:hypothetical protein [Pseudomonas phage ZQG1]
MSNDNKKSSLFAIRFTQAQREYLQSQRDLAATNPASAAMNWCEADMVRILVEEARQSNKQIVSMQSGVKGGE